MTAYDEELRLLEEHLKTAAAHRIVIAEIDALYAKYGGYAGTGDAPVASHSGGLDYVPTDNYRANLHRGETVLNDEAAAAWRMGSSGGGNNVTIASGAIVIQGGRDSADQIADKVLQAIQRKMTQQGISTLQRR